MNENNTVGHTEINAWGEHVRPLEEGRARRTKNPLALAMGSVKEDGKRWMWCLSMISTHPLAELAPRAKEDLDALYS